MKNILLASTAIAFLLASCDNNSTPTSGTTCYLSAANKDSISLTLNYAASEITGELNILPFEKDSRRGTLKNGKMQGDTLFAIYDSQQEGMRSECEIAFLKKDATYILSNDIYSETNYVYNADYTKGNFKDKSAIKFDGETLGAIDCPK